MYLNVNHAEPTTGVDIIRWCHLVGSVCTTSLQINIKVDNRYSEHDTFFSNN